MSEEEREEFDRTIREAATRYVADHYPDEAGVYVHSWVISVEWTSVDLERSNRGGLRIIAPHGQHLSTSRGLGEYAADRYAAFTNGADE